MTETVSIKKEVKEKLESYCFHCGRPLEEVLHDAVCVFLQSPQHYRSNPSSAATEAGQK